MFRWLRRTIEPDPGPVTYDLGPGPRPGTSLLTVSRGEQTYRYVVWNEPLLWPSRD